MDAIARTAKLSRPALYQYFTGKEEVFRAMGVRMLDEALTRAESARHRTGPVADRLYAVLAVRLELAVGPRGAEFRRELLVETADVAADLLASFQVRLIAIVEGVLSQATDELNLVAASISAHDAAAVLLDAVTGIEREAAASRTLHRRVRQLVALVVRGLARRS